MTGLVTGTAIWRAQRCARCGSDRLGRSLGLDGLGCGGCGKSVINGASLESVVVCSVKTGDAQVVLTKDSPSRDREAPAWQSRGKDVPAPCAYWVYLYFAAVCMRCSGRGTYLLLQVASRRSRRSRRSLVARRRSQVAARRRSQVQCRVRSTST